MAGHYIHAEKYQISSWLLGCIEKEIGDHVIAERERIIELIEKHLDWSYDIGISDKESGCQIDVEQLIYLIKGEQK